VSDITDQMGDVNNGLDKIQVLQAQGHEMFASADSTERQIRRCVMLRCVRVYTYVCMYVCVFVCVYICVYIYMYI